MNSAITKTLLHTILVFISLLSLNTQAGITITYVHNDALGSPVAGTDEQGAVKWRSHYQPYGEERLGERPLFGVRTGYTGHRGDPETGLTYMGARYYSPTLGRFMGVDPVGVNEGNIHSFNRYAYANNNPYRFIDPDGQESREAAFKQLGLQDPSAGVANRARQIADGASAFGDAVESAATDPTNLIPGGVFAGILKKIGGKLVTKIGRQKGDRFKFDDDALQQLEEIEIAQQKVRKGKSGQIIDKIDKSKQRAKHQLDRISLDDIDNLDD